MPTYQYIFSLQDKLSNPMQRVAASGNSAYSKLTGKQQQYNRLVDDGSKRMGVFSGGVGKLKAAIGGFIGLQVGKTMFSWATGMEQTQIAFQTLTQSVEVGNKLFEDIAKFANVTPFSNSALQKSAETMLSFGINAERIMPNLQMLGDVAGGDADKMRSLTLAFSQMSSAGKLMGQDLLQFVNAGFNPLNVIAQQTGKSMSDLRDEMSKGNISAGMVADAFKVATSEGGMFYQMMAKQSQSMGGKWATFMGKIQDSISRLMLSQGNVFTKILDKMIAGVDWFTARLPQMEAFLSGVAQVLGNVYHWLQANANTIQFLAVTIGGAMLAYQGWMLAMRAHLAIMTIYKAAMFAAIAFTRGWAVAQRALNITMMTNPVGLIIAGIAALAAGVIWAWNKFEGFRGAILGVWEVMKGFGDIIKNFVLDRIKGLLSGIGSIANAFKELFNGNFEAAWDSTKAGLRGIFGVDAAKNAIAAGQKLGASFSQGFEKGKDPSTKIKMPFSGILGGGGGAGSPGGVMGGLANVTGAGSGGSGIGTSADIKDGIAGITGGGQRNTNINVTLGSLIETFHLTSETLDEGVDRMREVVTEQLLRVLNSSSKLSTQQ